MKLSVVIPLCNSEKSIVGLLQNLIYELNRLKKISNYEVIMVNDCSPDNVEQVIQPLLKTKPKLKLISLVKNFGQHNAIMAGLNYASGDLILCMDDDGQTPPDQIPLLLAKINDGEGHDVVYAQYRHKKHHWLRNFASHVNNFLLRKLINQPKNLQVTSFFIMKACIAEKMIKYKGANIYLGALIFRATQNIAKVNVQHRNRTIGQSNYTFGKLVKLWFNGFTNFFIQSPHQAPQFVIKSLTNL